MSPEKKADAAGGSLGELRSILPYFRPYRRAFTLGIVCVVLANLFHSAGPYLMKLAIDGLTDPDVGASGIVRLAGLIVLVAILGGIARYGMRELLNGVSRRIEADLRLDFFRHLLTLDAAFYGSTRTGDLMSRATNDTLAVRMAAGPAIMYSVNTAVSFAAALGLMLWISPRLTLFAMIPMLALPPVVIRFGRVIHHRFEAIQEQFSSLSTFVQENLTGVRIVRAYTQEGEQERQFDAFNADYRKRNMSLAYSAGAFHPVLMLMAGSAMVVVLWLGGLEVMDGRITVGDYVAFSFYLVLLIWPMIALGWVVNLFQRGAASMGRLNRIFGTAPGVAPLGTERVGAPGAEPTPAPAPDRLRGEVTFEDVDFVYPGTERPVLEGVSFTARPGETVAIVGPTGAGKSTLLALVARIYDPTGGRVLLDGTPLRRWDPGALRRVIGMVPQDAFLFSETIANNIGLGVDGGTRHLRDGDEVPEVIVEATRIAQLEDQISEFPRRYHTLLGERGINLSGGQKQRATLARALARKPLILILDDALSAVDTHTEARILTDLREAMRQRTSFIVSHRVSAVMHADQILVLEGGRVVQRGRHAELIASEGTYARLLRRQMLEEGLESELVPADG